MENDLEELGGAPDRASHRHLRVGIRLTSTGASVVGAWLVDAPAVSLRPSGHPIVARVDVNGRVADIARFADPRIARSTVRKGLGHHYDVRPGGVVEINVPFGSITDLASLRIRLADTTGLNLGADDDNLTELFHDPPKDLRKIHEIGFADVRVCADWATIADSLGMPEEAGLCEMFRDKGSEYRWRIRRADGAIVAASGEGFRSRADCEAELTWVRNHAAVLPVVARDMQPPI